MSWFHFLWSSFQRTFLGILWSEWLLSKVIWNITVEHSLLLDSHPASLAALLGHVLHSDRPVEAGQSLQSSTVHLFLELFLGGVRDVERKNVELFVIWSTITPSILRPSESDDNGAPSDHVVRVLVAVSTEVQHRGDPTERPSWCSWSPDPTVAGHLLEEAHVVVAVWSQLGEVGSDGVGEQVTDVLQVALLLPVLQTELSRLGGLAELATVGVHRPAATKRVARSVVLLVGALTSTSLLRICATFSFGLSAVVRGLVDDLVVGGVGQVLRDPVPLDQAHCDPGPLALVAVTFLRHHQVLLGAVGPADYLRMKAS